MLVISLHYQFKQQHSACFWQMHIYINATNVEHCDQDNASAK